MPTTKLIDVSQLQDATTIYDKALRALPFVTISEMAQALKLNVMDLQGKHTRINERRRAGGTQAYAVDKTFTDFANILGYEPSDIEPKDVVFVTKENSKKYTDNELLVIGGKPTDNIKKRHPRELEVLSALVKSHAEDIVFVGSWFGQRDDSSTTPAGCMYGFYTKAAALLAKTDYITAARGNYAETGTLAAPTSDTDVSAYTILADFVGGAHNMLRSNAGGVPCLYIAEDALVKARAAFRNKLKAFAYPTMEQMIQSLREDALCPGLQVCTHEALGSGSQLILTKAGNLDFAFNTQSASRFCQVRDIYEDPNTWQFWLQSGYDTRINDWHEKVFRMNEQTNTSNNLAGDYVNTAAAPAQQGE